MYNLEEYKEIINSRIFDYLPSLPPASSILADAMRYSLEVGGKRLRPTLLLATCEFAGGSIEEALPYACAIEYIHTYSLIHDDLPAMDNDDLRRGKPTSHKVYGEALAILAGDALLSQAAEIVTGEPMKYRDNAEKLYSHIGAAHELISRAGASGMIAGQTADITSEHLYTQKEDVNSQNSGVFEIGVLSDIDPASLTAYIEEHKTGDLITAPVRAGLMIAGADDSMLDDFTKYAMNLGIAFQILDDILDIEGDPELMGKTLGKDAAEGKCNYAFVHGMDAAKTELARLTEEAKAAVSGYADSDFFISLADRLQVRKN